MVRDTNHDINEMRNCVDCYKHSNEKLHPKWFCLPCRNPHELVWAKQKGYPYWPAKVTLNYEIINITSLLLTFFYYLQALPGIIMYMSKGPECKNKISLFMNFFPKISIEWIPYF